MFKFSDYDEWQKVCDYYLFTTEKWVWKMPIERGFKPDECLFYFYTSLICLFLILTKSYVSQTLRKVIFDICVQWDEKNKTMPSSLQLITGKYMTYTWEFDWNLNKQVSLSVLNVVYIGLVIVLTYLAGPTQRIFLKGYCIACPLECSVGWWLPWRWHASSLRHFGKGNHTIVT